MDPLEIDQTEMHIRHRYQIATRGRGMTNDDPHCRQHVHDLGMLLDRLDLFRAQLVAEDARVR